MDKSRCENERTRERNHKIIIHKIMVKDFIQSYAQKIALKPEQIEVSESIDEEQMIRNITIYADNADVGRLIGKNGKMISSIKTLVSACKAKDGISCKIVVKAK